MSSPRPPELVRNVAVVGHAGAGKTTLVEALHRRTGTSSSDPFGLSSLEVGEIKVNLLDLPGGPDSLGALRAGLRAADSALFVLSAADGVDPLTVELWHECALVGTPRVVVVTKLDTPRGDFDDVVAVCQRLLGEGVHPLYLPMHGEDDSVAGLIGLLSQRVHDWSSGDLVERDPDPQHLPLIENLRGDLIEAIISDSEDETLLDRYLDGEELDPKVVIADLELAVARGLFHPVLPATPLSLLGTDELLEVLAQGMPSPLEHPSPVVSRANGSPTDPLSLDPAGSLAAQVISASGGQCLVKVYSGTLRPDEPVLIGERTVVLGGLGSPETRAGDLVTLILDAVPGETISSPGHPLLIEPWDVPSPEHPVALASDDPVLQQRVAQDLTARMDRDPDTGQLILWTLGKGHAQSLLSGLDAVVVAVDVPAGRVSTVEVTVPASFLRSVLSDLSGRRATVLSNGVDDEDIAHVTAEVPDTELVPYAMALRALSHGTGLFTRLR